MKKYIVHSYLAIWCIYNLQGVLYASGAMLSQLLLAVLLAWSLYYFILANIHYKLPNVLKILTVLIILWMSYGIITMIAGRIIRWIPIYYYLKNILMSLLPIYAFFVFARRGQLTERVLIGWLYIFLIVGIVGYYRNQREWMDKLWRDEVTNNAGYTMLSLLPLLPLLRRRPLIQYALLAVVMYFVLQGFKRGAIITGALASIFFLFGTAKTNRQSRGKTSFQQVLRVLFTVAIVIMAFYSVQRLLNTSDYFNEQIERTVEGDSSGRDILFSTAMSILSEETNPLILLFGHGGDATLKLLGNYAHNDWLEIAIDNGLWMIILYIVYWIVMLRYVVRTRKINPIAFMMVGLFFIIYFMKTLFSMSYNDVTFYASSALGYALAVGDNPPEEMESGK